jgi:hypothetical protein
MSTTNESQLAQEVAALRHTVAALVQAMGPRLTREQLCARRVCHRNTLAGLIERGTVPRPDQHGKFLLSEVLEFEAMERHRRMA